PIENRMNGICNIVDCVDKEVTYINFTDTTTLLDAIKSTESSKSEEIKRLSLSAHIFNSLLVWGYKNDGQTKPFLIFTEKERADEMRKNLIIPRLIKDKISTADQIIISYQRYIQEVENLETMLKGL
ncbi:MAG TPA: hypothetical protein VNX68_19630, partial [Nitrosopumilaceae archaeon]|nr:hypothetical protein [Nitrosopumilaceae archaeon]